MCLELQDVAETVAVRPKKKSSFQACLGVGVQGASLECISLLQRQEQLFQKVRSQADPTSKEGKIISAQVTL